MTEKPKRYIPPIVKEEWQINPCETCPYIGITCPEKHTRKFEVRVGDKIEIGTPIQGGGFFWGSTQTILWIDSSGTPWYRAKWGKVDKVAYCFRIPEKAVS